MNLWRGRGVDGRFVLDGGGHLVTRAEVPSGAAVALASPSAIALHEQRPQGSPRNVVEGVVLGVERMDQTARVQVGGSLPLVAEVTAGALAELGLASGDPVWASIKASEITVAPA
jgi:molybdopterin-binding protein